MRVTEIYKCFDLDLRHHIPVMNKQLFDYPYIYMQAKLHDAFILLPRHLGK